MDAVPDLQGKSKAELIALLVERETATAVLQSKFDEAQAEIDKLHLLIKQLQRGLYGRRAEGIDVGQLQLALEDIEQSAATAEAARGAVAPPRGGPRRTPRRNLGHLPESLPREEIVIEPDAKTCPCCGGVLHVIGEDVSEQLDVVPAQFKVRRIRRPRYGCRACEGAVVQAAAPERPIDGGLATEALVAHVIIAKYLDHQPLYRQAQIYARQGIALDRATLADWVGRAAWWLKPLYERLLANVIATDTIFADDTPVPVLDPGRGRTKTGRLWSYARDDRPWQGPSPPAVAYVYSESRGHQHPIAHLAGFTGVLQVDAFQAFDRLAAERPNKDVALAHCWAHTRRKFYDVHQATHAPIAQEALRRIGELYLVEAEIRGRPADDRRRGRGEKSRPLLDAFKPWLEGQLDRISGKSPLAQAIRYTLARWQSLTFYLDDGRLEIDTNTVERTMRPIAIGRKNWLFAGSDGGARSWAILASLIHSAKLNDLEPFTYVRDVLERIVSGRAKGSQLDTLLPWTWKAAQAADP